MLRWLAPENGEKDKNLNQKEDVRNKIRTIANSKENLEKLRTIAQSRSLGVWRIKRAKIILGTLEGKTVEKMVLEVRVPPESILKCQYFFAEHEFDYFKNPIREPTPREARVEQMLAFLENPLSKRSPQWNTVNVRYIGHDFSAKKIQQIRDLVAGQPELNRTELARQVCLLFDLYQTNGKIKLSQTKEILERMDMDNVITLPKVKNIWKSNKQKQPLTNSFPDAKKKIILLPSDTRYLQFIPVHSKKDSILWREIIEEFHYIKIARLYGPQLRYLVYGDETLPGTMHFLRSNFQNGANSDWTKCYNDLERGKHLVAVLGFASPAWRLSSRDNFIGWSDEQREANLRLVVNNVRFLIPPWVRAKNLASRILAGIAKQLPIDWASRYNYRPVLLETFVQQNRFKGTCYKAANWIQTGQTEGYSLSSNYKKHALIKSVWVYPLCKDFREKLCLLT